MKLFTALLGTETNTFCPFATGYKNFSESYLVRGGEHGDDPFFLAIPLVAWRSLASDCEGDLIAVPKNSSRSSSASSRAGSNRI